MWYFDVFAFIFSAHLSASQSIKCRNSHEMSTPDYYSSIIQQLWFISKVQLYLEWKHWNVRWKYCERAMSGDRKRETTHTVRIKLVIMTNVLCAMCRTVFGFVVWFFFHFMLKCIEMHASEVHTHALLCHRSKVCYRILCAPSFQIRPIRRKQRHEVTAPSHNNSIVKYIEEFSECISRVTSRRAAWTHMHDIPIYEEENIFCAKNCNKRKTCKITRKRNEESRERTNKRRQLLCIMCKARKTISNLKLQAYEKAT